MTKAHRAMLTQFGPWLAMLLTAGMWLGRLQQQVSDLREHDTYYHGQLHPGKD